MQIIKAVDVSSNNPNRTQATVDAWVAQGCQLLLVKSYSSVEPVALRQSTREWRHYAMNAGLWRQPYTWLYGSTSATDVVTSSAQLWDDIEGAPSQLVMLDAEAYVNQDGSIDHGPTVDQILEAASVCQSRHAAALLYTGNWWLDELAKREDVSRLRGMLAVIADYSIPPSMTQSPNDVVPNPYGLNIVGHQYTSNPQDWSVFDLDALTAAILDAQSPAPAPEPPTEIERLRAELTDARSKLGVASVDFADIITAQVDELERTAQDTVAAIRAVIKQLRALRP